jgi:hypothetical protein
MSISTCSSVTVAFVLPWLWIAPVCGQDVENKKLEMAYQWSREQFDKELSQIEQDYDQEIKAAQAKRAEAIKMARVRYNQGLEFLNSNPALPQSMRVEINTEMKRIAALPEPVAPPMPESDKSVNKESSKADRTKVTLAIDAPDTGWSVRILQSKKVGNEIWVLSALQHGSGISEMVVTPVRDSVIIEAPSDLPVRHFVLNKTWDSTKDPEGVKFISGVPDLGREWVLGELLQLRWETDDQ